LRQVGNRDKSRSINFDNDEEPELRTAHVIGVATNRADRANTLVDSLVDGLAQGGYRVAPSISTRAARVSMTTNS
jgi:hypothetical protein